MKKILTTLCLISFLAYGFTGCTSHENKCPIASNARRKLAPAIPARHANARPAKHARLAGIPRLRPARKVRNRPVRLLRSARTHAARDNYVRVNLVGGWSHCHRHTRFRFVKRRFGVTINLRVLGHPESSRPGGLCAIHRNKTGADIREIVPLMVVCGVAVGVAVGVDCGVAEGCSVGFLRALDQAFAGSINTMAIHRWWRSAFSWEQAWRK